MALLCEDLAAYGVALIAPGSQQYFDLLADIERRLQSRPAGGPPLRGGALSQISTHDGTSAVLVNRAKVAIASIAYIWTIRRADGRETTSSRSPGTNPSVLLPFFQMERVRRWDAYWNTIFAGSKRVITVDGVYGDNTDVRMPEAAEISSGSMGFGGSSGRGGEPVKLTLDGVFFVDGGFAGPNQLRSWEQLVAARGAFLGFAEQARKGASDRAAREEFFARIGNASTTPAPPPPPPPPRLGRSGQAGADEVRLLRENAEQRVASQLRGVRGQEGDEATLKRVAAWLDNPGPEPHRL